MCIHTCTELYTNTHVYVHLHKCIHVLATHSLWSVHIYIYTLSVHLQRDYALGLMYTGSQTCARQHEAFFPSSEGSYSKNIKAPDPLSKPLLSHFVRTRAGGSGSGRVGEICLEHVIYLLLTLCVKTSWIELYYGSGGVRTKSSSPGFSLRFFTKGLNIFRVRAVWRRKKSFVLASTCLRACVHAS